METGAGLWGWRRGSGEQGAERKEQEGADVGGVRWQRGATLITAMQGPSPSTK